MTMVPSKTTVALDTNAKHRSPSERLTVQRCVAHEAADQGIISNENRGGMTMASSTDTHDLFWESS